MKRLSLAIMVASLAIGTAAVAKDRPNPSDNFQLRQALKAIASTANAQGPKSPGQFNPKVDRDQGDDRASPWAILVVCSKDTPAAHRSAICPTGGVSPE